MKKSIFLFTLIFVFQCKSQVGDIKPNFANSEFEKFDFTKLKKIIYNDGTYTYETKQIKQEDSTKIKIIANSLTAQVEFKYYKGWFNFYKIFYRNGNVKNKFVTNKTESNGLYFKEYEFDESGNLVKTTDYDKDYKTSFEQITIIAGKYGKKYGYQAKTGMNDVIEDKLLWNNDYVKIWRKEYKQKKYWLIGFNKPQYKNSDDKKCERLVVVVDDATGKVIKKEHYYDWYNRFLKDIEKLVK